MPNTDYKALYQAEREKREAIEADIKKVAEVLSPVYQKLTDKGGRINEMKAITVIGSLVMDAKFKASISDVLPSLMKYEYLVTD